MLLIRREQYVGEFMDGAFNGQGTYTWPDGQDYVGEFENDLFHGQGTYTLPDGEQYIGEYRDGVSHGQGTYIFADGYIEEGVFENGEYLGTVAEFEEAKNRYDRIYSACLVDKSDGVDMSVRSVESAVIQTCEEIADNPSWLDRLWYN